MKIIYSNNALNDFDRLTDFLLEKEPAAAYQTVGLITEAVEILANHPLIG